MSHQKNSISIGKDGTLTMIYDDKLVGLLAQGQAVTTRASHVEPAEGGWVADLSPVNGPKLGPFPLRQEALDAEVAYLLENIIK